MSYLARKIGVFYNNECWADDIFKQLLGSFDKDAVNRIVFSINEKRIELKTGTIVWFIKASDSARGYRLHEAYLQEGIGKEIYQCIIKPICILGSGGLFILKDIRDFQFPRIKARDYYLRIAERDEPVPLTSEQDGLLVDALLEASLYYDEANSNYFGYADSKAKDFCSYGKRRE